VIHLEAGPCVVRPWQREDLESLVRHANNGNVARQLRDRFPHPYTRADGESWLALAAAQKPQNFFAIDVAGEAVGGIGVMPGHDVERVSAEVGYWLGEGFWGRGIATAALAALVGHVFSTHDLTRLFALPFAHNLASRRVLEKAGFRLDAILRKSAIKEGRVLDQALYSLVRD
jgi:ribosomal-protein-alanine N-acetyltransferase